MLANTGEINTLLQVINNRTASEADTAREACLFLGEQHAHKLLANILAALSLQRVVRGRLEGTPPRQLSPDAGIARHGPGYSEGR